MNSTTTLDAPVASLCLAESLDLIAASPLAEQLLKLRGQPVVLDAREVQRLGAQCLQVLLSAAQTWKSDGISLEFIGCSQRFSDDLKLLGVEPTLLGMRTPLQ